MTGKEKSKLSNWAKHQRDLHRKGMLPIDCQKELESIPGWKWDIEKKLPLSIEKILGWADLFHAKNKAFPNLYSGGISGTDDTWSAIDSSLNTGRRGLPGGTSLCRLLEKHRGYKHHLNQPPLTEKQVLDWADSFFAEHGRWPASNDGEIAGTSETWSAINSSLNTGRRGLPREVSLCRLLEKHRGYKNRLNQPPLTEKQVLDWTDSFFAEHGKWPASNDGGIAGTSETWHAIDYSLRRGRRGLPGGRSLCRLLEKHRGYKHNLNQPPLTVKQVLDWADSFFAEHGRWPIASTDGGIAGTSETWHAIDGAMKAGCRGLPKLSLPNLLEKHRGHKNRLNQPPLTVKQILDWADSFFAEHGRWPIASRDGGIAGTSETWHAIDGAMRAGCRGLPGGRSLCRLLEKHRGHKNRLNPPPLTEKQILDWADSFYAKYGKFPSRDSGKICGATDTWLNIDVVLGKGERGLKAGNTLVRLLQKHRGYKKWDRSRQGNHAARLKPQTGRPQPVKKPPTRRRPQPR